RDDRADRTCRASARRVPLQDRGGRRDDPAGPRRYRGLAPRFFAGARRRHNTDGRVPRQHQEPGHGFRRARIGQEAPASRDRGLKLRHKTCRRIARSTTLPRMPGARILTRAGAFAVSMSLFSLARGDVQSPASTAGTVSFQQTVRPILAKYCFECHGTKKQESGLNLSTFQDDAAVLAAKKKWKDVWQKVDTKEMPPAGNAEPSAAEREKITGYIESALAKIDGRGAEDPGRVVIRRLNRTEYKNTVRDLLGIEA